MNKKEDVLISCEFLLEPEFLHASAPIITNIPKNPQFTRAFQNVVRIVLTQNFLTAEDIAIGAQLVNSDLVRRYASGTVVPTALFQRDILGTIQNQLAPANHVARAGTSNIMS